MKQEVDVIAPFRKAYAWSLIAMRDHQNLPEFDRAIATQVFTEEISASYATVHKDVKQAHDAFLNCGSITTSVMNVSIAAEAVRMAKITYARMGIETV